VGKPHQEEEMTTDRKPTHEERARAFLTNVNPRPKGVTAEQHLAAQFAEVEAAALCVRLDEYNAMIMPSIHAKDRLLVEAGDRIAALEAKVRQLADENGFDAFKVERQQDRIAALEADLSRADALLLRSLPRVTAFDDWEEKRSQYIFARAQTVKP
jgi:hypothetical protein